MMRSLVIAAALFGVTGVGLRSSALAADPTPARSAAVPTLFSSPLNDVPGKRLVVVRLTFPPANGAKSFPHRHPGSVYVYVTQGTARLGVEGQPVQVVPAGGSFFEPKGALHTVAVSASPTEPAYGIAVMIVPEGAPLVLPADRHAAH